MKNNKKVGIVTLCGNNNYGNKLQNFAVLFYVSKMDYNVETIWICNPFLDNPIKQILKYFKKVMYENIKLFGRRAFFINFNKYLNIKSRLFFNHDFRKVKNKYDYFIVGSDQVWNYNYFDNDSIYFLSDSNKRNISFSASFGVSDIPKEYYNRYKNGLNNFDFISVRENRGQSIVKELTGRKDVEVLVDPTMLLTNKEWDKVSKKPRQFDKLDGKKYILNYFLGELSSKRKNAIEKFAKKYGCKIINIFNKNDPFYESGPSEFLYLEKHAFLICTDSFHSSVFAILYNKPFVVFDREQSNVENMSSRIDTLLSKFKLKNRRYNGNAITKDNLEHDYTEAYKILEVERKKSKKFLERALCVEEK